MYNTVLLKYAQLEQYTAALQQEAVQMGALLSSPSHLSEYYRRLEYETGELPSIREFRTAYPQATYEQYAEWVNGSYGNQPPSNRPVQPGDAIPLPPPPNPAVMSGGNPWQYIQGNPTQAWRVIDQAGIGALLQ